MSGLALVCRELGAEVTGSDRAESSYIERLRAAGIEPAIGHDAGQVPEDAEVVVSTAIGEDNPELAVARERGQRVLHRGELLAELCERGRLLADRRDPRQEHDDGDGGPRPARDRRRPLVLPRGELPGAGPEGGAANAAAGAGEWVVAEADESDGSFLKLAPGGRGDHEPRARPPLALGLARRAREAFAAFSAGAAARVIGADVELPGDAGRKQVRFALEPQPGDPPAPDADLVAERIEAAARAAGRASARPAAASTPTSSSPCRAATTSPTPWRRSGPSRWPGADPDGVRQGAGELPRRRAADGAEGGAPSGARIYDDYAHHPTEVEAALAAARELEPRRLIAAFQPHLYSRTKALATEFGAALAAADEVAVLDVYPAREEPVGPLEGVSGVLVAEAAADHAGGRPVWWLPDAEAAARRARPAPGERRPAGHDRRRGHLQARRGAGRVSSRDRPDGVERDYPLARLTTVRVGGPADYFAQPETEEEVVALLAWAEAEALRIGVVGSGSNLLVADAGFRGLVMKLAGELTTIEREGETASWRRRGAAPHGRRAVRRTGASRASSSGSTSPAPSAARCG